MKTKTLYSFFKKLIFCVLFLGIIINVLSFYMPLFRDEEQKAEKSVLTDFYEEDKDIANIVFVGSSAVYRFIAPTQIYSNTGVVTLNYAAGALDIAPTCAIIDEVIDYQHPDLIVVEMRNYVNNCEEYMNGKGHSDFQMTEKWGSFDKFINSVPNSVNKFRMINDTVLTTMRKNLDDVLAYQFEYFTTHTNWKDLSLNDTLNYTEERFEDEVYIAYQDQEKMEELYYQNKLSSKPLKTEINENGKEVVVPYEAPVYKGTDYKTTIGISSHVYQKPVDYTNYEKRNEISGEWLKMLERIMKKAKTCGTKVVFMTSPHLLTETEMAYENTMADILKENGFDFICGNKLMHEIGLDFEEDFYDDMHVNIRGMVKFTDYVSNYLIKTYNIEAQSLNKTQEAEWKIATQKWIEEVRDPGIKSVEKAIENYKNAS